MPVASHIDLSTLTAGLSESEVVRVAAVYHFAQQHLSDIHRRTGVSYFQHCFEVAITLKEACADADLLSVALLHDLFEHPDHLALLVNCPLDAVQQDLAREMHGLRRLDIEHSTKDLDRVIDAIVEDPRLLLLRMAHRVNDVRNHRRFAPELWQQLAAETLHMYTAIAERVGMRVWRIEMENTCFAAVQPEEYTALEAKFAALKQADTVCLEQTAAYLLEKFTEAQLQASFVHRIKSIYSTYRKMNIKNRNFEDLNDRIGLRIVVPEIADCYRALGLVHANMNPIAGKLKDYIGAPKENGYQSIHTCVYPLPGVTDQRMEIQIRTQEMQGRCHFGPLSHANYKQAMYAMASRPTRVHLMRNLQSLHSQTLTPRQFSKHLREYFKEDQIVIFDADSTLYHLKAPVTALDFVCQLYPKQCTRLKEVRINGRRRPIETDLIDGDTVEPVFGRTNTVCKDWDQACHSDDSKRRIRRCCN